MLKYSLNRCNIIDYFEWVSEIMSVQGEVVREVKCIGVKTSKVEAVKSNAPRKIIVEAR